MPYATKGSLSQGLISGRLHEFKSAVFNHTFQRPHQIPWIGCICVRVFLFCRKSSVVLPFWYGARHGSEFVRHIQYKKQWFRVRSSLYASPSLTCLSDDKSTGPMLNSFNHTRASALSALTESSVLNGNGTHVENAQAKLQASTRRIGRSDEARSQSTAMFLL